jgi:hypothetical protein
VSHRNCAEIYREQTSYYAIFFVYDISRALLGRTQSTNKIYRDRDAPRRWLPIPTVQNEVVVEAFGDESRMGHIEAGDVLTAMNWERGYP